KARRWFFTQPSVPNKLTPSSRLTASPPELSGSNTGLLPVMTSSRPLIPLPVFAETRAEVLTQSCHL
ncbi:MAG: hypothetical protein RQ982_12840, partial [Gammaproteobacteria bacterium]|nr:hypothetical protein [Gammaproteobacteria bacterium]